MLRNKMLVGLIFIILLSSCSTVGQEESTYSTSNPNALYYTNPIVEQRADPWIYKHEDGYYYMMASVPEYDRLELRRSTTITGLAYAEPKTVWAKNESGVMSKNIWAPEIYHIDGKWYIYFSAAKAESEFDHRMYVLENSHANPLEGEWELKGQLRTGYEQFQIDGSLFEHQGIWYLMWSGAGAKGNSLYMAQLKNPWTVSTSRILLTEPQYDWEKRAVVHVTEAPEVIKYDDRIYLTYSASFCDANYNMGLLTASSDSDLMNPSSWEKYTEPIFVSNPSSNAYGPGHGSFVFSKNGSERIHVYHGVDGSGKGYGCDKARNVRIQTYTFDSTGELKLGEPTSRGMTLSTPTGENRVEFEQVATKRIVDFALFSQGKGVSMQSKADDIVINQLRAPDTGMYALSITYFNEGDASIQKVKINGKVYEFSLAERNRVATSTLFVELLGSENELVLLESKSPVLLDYIELNYIDIELEHGNEMSNLSLMREDVLDSLALSGDDSTYPIQLSLPQGDYVLALAYKLVDDGASIKLDVNNKSFPLELNAKHEWQFASITTSLDGKNSISISRTGDIDVAFIRILRALPEAETFSFINRETGLALQPNGGSKKEGSGYRQYVITHLPAQSWVLERVEVGMYRLKNEISGLYMTEEDGQVVQKNKNNAASQYWTFTYVTDGSYRIQSAKDKLVPTSIDPNPNEFENTIFAPWEVSNNQTWYVNGIN